MAYLGVRVLKAAGAEDLPWRATLPPDCRSCRLDLTPQAAGQNSRELYYHVWVPSNHDRLGPLRIEVNPARVRRVLISFTDLDLAGRGYVNLSQRANGLADAPITREPHGISFSVPTPLAGVSMPPDDLTDVTQFYTYIETPGLYIRIGHADERRRAGPYAATRWPQREASAALNLEFGTREAVEKLSLVTSFAKKGVDKVMLMNFDTNYPTLGPSEAHEDWPPHWHMHLFWKDAPKVRRVGHFYIAPDGLLSADMASDLQRGSKAGRVQRWFRRGEPDETRTPSGELVYGQTITSEGWFRLTSERGSCLLKPLKQGFDSGVLVTCSGGALPVSIKAADDPVRGRLRLDRNGKLAREYSYDIDTGALLGPPS